MLLPMDLRFGHLCDYATVGAARKLILVGLFDQVTTPATRERIVLPLCYLVFKVECSLYEGSEHQIQVRLKDDDETTLQDADGREMDFDLGQQRFTPSGRGRPLSIQVTLPCVGLSVPTHGDYAFEILVGGARLGDVRFYVVEPPSSEPG
jgi:hypothetical protein